MKKPVKAKPVPCTHKINSKGQDVSDHVHTDMLRRGRDANGVPPVVGLGDGTITGDGKFVAEAPPFPESGNANEFKGVTRPNLIRLILATREHAQDQAITHADQLALAIGQRDAAAANLVASQRRLEERTAQRDQALGVQNELFAHRDALREEIAELTKPKPTLRARIKGWISRHRNYGWLVLLLVVGLAQIGAAQSSAGAPLPKICGADRNEQCMAAGAVGIGDEPRGSVGIPEGEAINAEPIGRHLLVPSAAWDVPAVEYETPASHPRNVSTSTADGLFTYAVCITAPETHWKCNDSARILLTSEDGVRHCILFPPQQVEVMSVKRWASDGTSATDCPTGVPGETSSYGDYSNNGVCILNGANWIPLTSGGANVKPTPKAKVPQPKAKKVPAVRKAQP
jgi:hypothetical protein